MGTILAYDKESKDHPWNIVRACLQHLAGYFPDRIANGSILETAAARSHTSVSN
jgi:hypothetical protein